MGGGAHDLVVEQASQPPYALGKEGRELAVACSACLRSHLAQLGSFRIESNDNVSSSLIMATEGTGDLVGSTAVSARKQDLAAAQNEGFRRAQTRLQGLTLVVREWTHEYGLFHEHRINSCLPSRLRMQWGSLLPLSAYLLQSTCLDLVDEPANALLVRDERTSLDAPDRLVHVFLEVGEGLKGKVGL